jgi:hypothetical protein
MPDSYAKYVAGLPSAIKICVNRWLYNLLVADLFLCSVFNRVALLRS